MSSLGQTLSQALTSALTAILPASSATQSYVADNRNAMSVLEGTKPRCVHIACAYRTMGDAAVLGMPAPKTGQKIPISNRISALGLL